LDELVLDLTDFVPSHPGGEFALLQNVGRDISKFFYGGYSLDGNAGRPGSNSSAYAHSNMARKIANKYAIAVLASRTKPVGRFTIDHSKTLSLNKSTSSFVFKKLSYSANIGHGVDSSVYFPDDIAQLGKHFLFSSLGKNGVPISAMSRILKRHYTITNSLRESMYKKMIECLNSGNNQIGELETKIDSVHCSIKDYKL